jgi:[phosphatase 2A protein]-leucine-carboxy methyltransferase
MRTAIDKFLEQNPSDCQVINIGAGFDTMPFHLAERNIPNLRIFEVDFPDLLLRKATVILKSPELIGTLMRAEGQEMTAAEGTMTMPTLRSITTAYGYRLNQLRLLGSDLHQPEELVRSLIEAGLVPETPTLILTECVLVCELSLPSPLSSLHRIAR